MSYQFLTATFNEELRMPHYFNGRLLTANELQTEQRAVQTRQNWLGQASGYGIIDGLAVSQSDTAHIKITAGSGLNRLGQLLYLSSHVTLSLPLQSSSQSTNDAGNFAVCSTPNPQNTQNTQNTDSTDNTAIATGTYLLTALPTSRVEGLAPTQFTQANGITSKANNTANCDGQWEVAGIQFKIIPLTDFEQVSGVNDTNRRDCLAQWCYGSEIYSGLAFDPFHYSPTDGLDRLNAADFTSADLPLAVFYWTGTTLSFVDVWSVRRRLTRPNALIDTPEPPSMNGLPVIRSWKGLLSDQRAATAQARFLQFQDHIQQLIADKQAATVAMKDYFRFLPPLGFLPVTLDSLLNLIGPPLLSPTAGEIQSSPANTPFFIELQSVLQTRLAQGNTSEGENGFDYATFFGTPQYFWIRTKMNTNFVMDVTGANPQSGTQVISHSQNSPATDNQLWYFKDGYIISKLNGYVLTASMTKTLTYTDPQTQQQSQETWVILTVSEKNNQSISSQQWSVDTDAHLESGGLVADVFHGLTNEDTPIIANPHKNIQSSTSNSSTATANQQWHIDSYTPNTTTDASLPLLINQAMINGEEIASLVQHSWDNNAVRTAHSDSLWSALTPSINVYFVRENLYDPSLSPYLIFALAQRPFNWSISPDAIFARAQSHAG